MFLLGVFVGAVVAGVVASVVLMGQRRRLTDLEDQRRAHERRISELERAVETERAAGASAVRNTQLRTERQFVQYKILLKRADRALAEARAARDRRRRIAA